MYLPIYKDKVFKLAYYVIWLISRMRMRLHYLVILIQMDLRMCLQLQMWMDKHILPWHTLLTIINNGSSTEYFKIQYVKLIQYCFGFGMLLFLVLHPVEILMMCSLLPHQHKLCSHLLYLLSLLFSFPPGVILDLWWDLRFP